MADNYSINSDFKSENYSTKNSEMPNGEDEKDMSNLVVDTSVNKDKRNAFPGQGNTSPSKKYNINSSYHANKSMNEKYLSSKHEFLEAEFKKKTTGLISAEEFKRRKDNLDKGISEITTEKNLLKKRDFSVPQKLEDLNSKENINKKKDLQKKKKHLSFIDDIEENSSSSDESDTKAKISEPIKKIKKDPLANTSFLPDLARDQRLEKLRSELTKEYYDKEKIIRDQQIEVYYKYWDGFQQIQKLRLKKDTKISVFTECVRQELQVDYPDMRSINGEYGLMYVLDNTIVPPTISFFDVLKNKVKGPNGLL